MNYDDIERLLIDREYGKVAQLGAAAIPYLIAALKDKNVHMRLRAAEAVEVLAGNPHNAEVIRFVPVLMDALKEEDWEMRERASRVLGDIAERNDVDRRKVQKALEEFVASVRKRGNPTDIWHAELEGAAHYMEIAEAARRRTGKKHSLAGDGVILVGEFPKPPQKGKMYRSEARAIA